MITNWCRIGMTRKTWAWCNLIFWVVQLEMAKMGESDRFKEGAQSWAFEVR